MKVFDCFTFFNELDLLEFRLKLLNLHVDYFIIAESNLTHSGKPKSFYFEENKTRFSPWLHKIIYRRVSQTTEGLVFDQNETAYNPQSASWKLENEQRNALLSDNSVIKDEDLVLLSDLDEIPDPVIFKKIKTGADPVSFSMLLHYYFFNCQNTGSERWWNGTIASSGKQFKEQTPQILRDNRNNYQLVKKAGWHFSYLGGVEKIKQKIRSFAHTEFNKEEFVADENILTALAEGRDIFNRPGAAYKFFSIYFYPKHIRAIMLQYPSFLNLAGKKSFLQKIYYSVKRNIS